MKTAAKSLVIEIEDDDFLSQVAAAEAQALASKRRRISIAPSSNAAVSFHSRANHKEGSDGEDGGIYTAALKGSQRAAPEPPRGGFSTGRVNVGQTGNDGISSGGGSCFKCGKPGHWARDCDVAGGGGGGGGGGGYYGNSGGGDSSSSISVPEKSCPCGFGACMVLTANTEKNRGRKFYKCPLRQENGGCGFFEWCDNASGPNVMASTGMGSGSATRTHSYAASDSSFPALECPCGGGLCLILTAKTGKNIGSQFYRCPANEGCGFFKWCNEHTGAAAGVLGGGAAKVERKVSSEASNNGFGVRTGSSCFKCGKEGHWARDCPAVPSYNAPVELGARSAASPGSCYKCGKPGHWARDCPSG
ncbi:unnamed protein product [Prunus armeniaca]|nr:hypothetical protein GBA52_011048 [Prunus armeniaca]